MTNDTPTPHCTVDDCKRPVLARSFCAPHYSTWHRSQKKYTITCKACGKVAQVARKTATTCSRKCAASVAADASNSRWEGHEPSPRVDRERDHECAECGAEFKSAGPRKYCSPPCRSSGIKRSRGDERSAIRAAVEDRDYAAVIREVSTRTKRTSSGCWQWTGRMSKGYPRITLGGVAHQVHRIVLEAKEGAPLGVQAAHHMCANPQCVNPDHLQPVTARENVAEMLARNAYIDRIRELESALAEADPAHPALDRLPLSGIWPLGGSPYPPWSFWAGGHCR